MQKSLILAGVLLVSAPRAWGAEGRIVNGLLSSEFPSVALLIANGGTCSATLIGCQTVLTAAHCVCGDEDGNLLNGAACAARPDLLDPSKYRVFFQHAGFFSVAKVTVNPNFDAGVDPNFDFAEGSDEAILKLARPINGIAPSAVNTTAPPLPGSSGTIAGFGLTGKGGYDVGLKFFGDVRTVACDPEIVKTSSYVCWDFLAPVGPPGTDSNTCNGDSGGPLFVDFGSGPLLGGVTAGGVSSTCQPTDHSFNVDVFPDRTWIQSEGGADLGNGSCGDLPQAGGAGASILASDGTLSSSHPEDASTFTVPPGTRLLRVALNAAGYDANDFDLFVRQGAPATDTEWNCAQATGLALEECEVTQPAAGTWHALVKRRHGGGQYQVTATLFAQPAPTPCVANDTALCLQGGRFKVEASFATAQGPRAPAHAVGLTADTGTFWFFGASNVELVAKVLDACGPFGRFWFFAGGLTNLDTHIIVTDSQTGQVKVYRNAQGAPFASIQDTETFATCP